MRVHKRKLPLKKHTESSSLPALLIIPLSSALWNINNRRASGCVPAARVSIPRCWTVYIAVLCELTLMEEWKGRAVETHTGREKLHKEVPWVCCCSRNSSRRGFRVVIEMDSGGVYMELEKLLSLHRSLGHRRVFFLSKAGMSWFSSEP